MVCRGERLREERFDVRLVRRIFASVRIFAERRVLAPAAGGTCGMETSAIASRRKPVTSVAARSSCVSGALPVNSLAAATVFAASRSCVATAMRMAPSSSCGGFPSWPWRPKKRSSVCVSAGMAGPPALERRFANGLNAGIIRQRPSDSSSPRPDASSVIEKDGGCVRVRRRSAAVVAASGSGDDLRGCRRVRHPQNPTTAPPGQPTAGAAGGSARVQPALLPPPSRVPGLRQRLSPRHRGCLSRQPP